MEYSNPISDAFERRMAARALGVNTNEVILEALDPEAIEIAQELNELLKLQAALNNRLRELTGESSTKMAIGKAREIVKLNQNTISDTQEEKTTLQPLPGPDDRDPSTSIRALRGGLPTLGRNRR